MEKDHTKKYLADIMKEIEKFLKHKGGRPKDLLM